MKAQLETARAVVRALQQVPRCLALRDVVSAWDGVPSPVWRKRIARHLRGCRHCAAHFTDLVPPEGLLVGLAVVPLPLAGPLAAHTSSGAAAWAAGAAGTTAAGAAGPKTLVALATAAALAAGAIALQSPSDSPRSSPPSTASASSTGEAGLPAPAAAPATRSASPSAARTPSAPADSARAGTSISASPSQPQPSQIRAALVRRCTTASSATYGETVDQADAAPNDPAAASGSLPRRLQRTPATITVAGRRTAAGSSRRLDAGQSAALTGEGYIRVVWTIRYDMSTGPLRMPTWTGLEGKLFHVASGGGHRMDDAVPEAGERTWMGKPSTGYDVLPSGALQMWQAEYYYLDGSVTLNSTSHSNAPYSLEISSATWQNVHDDLATPPSPSVSQSAVRYGIVRDAGCDAAPVPQYLTRATPPDPTTVRRDTDLT